MTRLSDDPPAADAGVALPALALARLLIGISFLPAAEN
jgi:hypothetical protein